MKSYRNILSMGFSLLVLLSSSYYMVGFHLCSGQVQNIAFFSKAESCPLEKQMPPCHRQEKSCCDNEVIVHEAQDFKNSITEFNFHPEFISGLSTRPELLSEIIREDFCSVNFAQYQPPWRTPDLTVSHRIFRI